MKNKIISLFLVFVSLILLCGCKKSEDPANAVINREYDKAAVEAAAEALLSKSLSVNEILFGAGLDFEEEGGNGIYKKATAESLSKYGVNSVEDILSICAEVYSSGYMNTVKSSDIFKSVSDGSNIVFYTRYYNGEDGGIFVNSVYEYALKNKYEYISRPEALRSEGDSVIVKVTVRATIIGESGETVKSRDFDHEIKMVEENGQWRLHSSSFIVYNEYTDIYDSIK